MTGSVLSITTLADLEREGWALTAQCRGRHCGAGRRLDVNALIAQFGPDHVIVNAPVIPGRLRCRRCGHRGGQLQISAPSANGNSIAVRKLCDLTSSRLLHECDIDGSHAEPC